MEIFIFQQVAQQFITMANKIQFVFFFGLGTQDQGIVAFLFFQFLLAQCMKIYSKAVLFLIDGYDVLRKLFKTEHSLVLFPIYLKTAVGKDL